MGEINVSDLLEQQYLEADNKDDLDYWAPFSRMILESVESRDKLGFSQQRLAEEMGSRQSVISRFENMGRLPSYDFIARMAKALGHAPGMTLYGDYMATVPISKQEMIKAKASESGLSTQTYVARLLEKAISEDQLAINLPGFNNGWMTISGAYGNQLQLLSAVCPKPDSATAMITLSTLHKSGQREREYGLSMNADGERQNLSA